MKKLISLLICFAIVISLCACAGDSAVNTTDASTDASAATEETQLDKSQIVIPTLEEVLAEQEAKKLEGQPTPEQLYGHINQLEPVDGVYKIWSEVGVQNMADHPDATFEFLCNVDMNGATVRPIGTAAKPFTGKINGVNCTLSNFTISESVDGYLGFIAVNNGTIQNLTLDQVTIVADASTKYVGSVAGASTTAIERCTVNGTITVEAAAEEAVCGSLVGHTVNDIINSVANVDISYTAAGSATIGGVAGVAEDGHMEFTETYGDLVISGSNKTAGLICGSIKNVTMYTMAFLGEQNTVDGVLFENYFGTEDNVEIEKILVRDNKANPLPEKQQELRDRVVAYMREMGTIRWTTTENLYHDCHCQLTICHGAYKPGMLHLGIPYNHYSTSLARFQNCLDENNLVQDWLYDTPSVEGFDIYFGNDCSGAVQQAWWRVSNSTDVKYCEDMQPIRGKGAIAVGQWPTDVDVLAGENSEDELIPLMELNDWFEAFAQVRAGDAYVHIGENGNHTRMAAEDAVIVRDENGLIDGDYSYIITHEQGAPAVTDPYFCTWRIDYKYSFKNLVLGGYFPVTCEELLTGEMDAVECELVGGAEGKAGMTVGSVEANYHIDYVTLNITDSQGNTVLNHNLNGNADYRSTFGGTDMGIRNICLKVNMAMFASVLQTVTLERGETYEYTVTALLSTGDEIVVKTDSFANGSV